MNEQKNMNCEYFEPLISAKLDDELSVEENEHLQIHLDSCLSCQRLLNGFEEVNVAVEYLSFQSYGEQNIVSIKPINAVAKRTKSKKSIFSIWNVIPAAVAASVLVCLCIVAMPSPKPVNADQISPAQVAQPIRELRELNLQQQKDQELMLRTLGMDLRTMKLEINQLEPGSKEREVLTKQIEMMLERVRLFEERQTQ